MHRIVLGFGQRRQDHVTSSEWCMMTSSTEVNDRGWMKCRFVELKWFPTRRNNFTLLTNKNKSKNQQLHLKNPNKWTFYKKIIHDFLSRDFLEGLWRDFCSNDPRRWRICWRDGVFDVTDSIKERSKSRANDSICNYIVVDVLIEIRRCDARDDVTVASRRGELVLHLQLHHNKQDEILRS